MIDTPLLEGLAPDDRCRLVGLFTRRDYPTGAPILREGEACDDLYLVESGTLLVRTRRQGDLAHVGPGECLGEVSLFTGQPASATVITMTNAVLWVAPQTEIRTLLHEVPRLASNVGRLLGQRLVARTARRKEREVALLVSAAESAGTGFALNLAASVAHHSGEAVALVDLSHAPSGACATVAPVWERPPASVTVVRAAGARPDRLHALVTELAGDYRSVLIWAPEGEGAREREGSLPRFGGGADSGGVEGARGTDRLAPSFPRSLAVLEPLLPLVNRRLVILPGECWDRLGRNDPGRGCADALAPTAPHQVPTELVILGAPEPRSPSATEAMEQRMGLPVVSLLPAVPESWRRADVVPDWVLRHRDTPFARGIAGLARRLAGKRVGIALGAGAGRGYAHIWALRALEQLGIRPDVIAGTSIGGVIALFYASGVSYEGMEQILVAFGRSPRRWSLPVYSFLAGTAWDRSCIHASLTAQAALSRARAETASADRKELRLEDLLLPCALIAADFLSGEEVVLRRGLAWQAGRASATMPGIFPPIDVEGRLLMDGGLANPVPCRVARELGADVVLGVPLEVVPAPERRAGSAGRAGAGRRRPTWPEVLVRSYDLLQWGLTQRCLQEADVVVRITTPAINLLDFSGGPAFVEAGERAVEAARDELAALLPWAR